MTIISPNPILIMILFLGGMQTWQRWQHRHDPRLQCYFRISPAQR